MPEKSQIVSVTGYDAATIQSIAFASYLQLGWNVKFAGNKMLVGYTPRSLTKYDEQVIVSVEDQQYTVNSKMIHGEAFDMLGKNKKHIAGFIAAFENVRTHATANSIAEWKSRISSLSEQTAIIAEREVKQAEEADKVMNTTSGKTYVTYALIAINALVFIAMAAGGVDFMNPGPQDIFNWGGSTAYRTSHGEEWRLLTNTFVHIGFLHLLFNMYGLYFIGAQLEPLLGRTRYTAAYLCTGILASVASMWWHKDQNIVSAGASGAIFGLFGVFLALLSTQLIPKNVRKGLLQSTAIFVGYNLFYGLKGGVDNSAHIGGLLSGMVIGYLFYFFRLKNKETETSVIRLTTSIVIVVATIIISFLAAQSVASSFGD